MANNFLITISAVDRATATVAKINASMNRITAPIRNIQKSAAALSREMGFDKFGKSLANVAKTTSALGGKLASLAAPLAVVVGGGTLAGVAALATEWARLGSEISRSALTLGMAAGELQGLRGAARAAGLSSDELTGGLKSLGDTMEDALYGRNQQALVMLNQLRIGFHKTSDGSIDTARSFRDLAGAISGIKNVQAQALVARTFGMESLLPLLRQGPAAIDAYERKVKELGGVMSGPALAAAQSFGLSLNYLHIATDGLKNTIGEKLVPILQPLVDRLTAWTAANRELIATKVGDFVAGLARWVDQLDFNKIADDIKDFGIEVGKVVDFLGGWKNAALAVVIVLNGSLIASVINLGLALGRLAITGFPVAIRGALLFAGFLDATLVPALLKGILRLGLFTGGVAEAAAGIPILGPVLAGLSEGILGVGAAIAATPIGWLIAGAAAIAASVFAIYKNWDKIVGYFDEKMKGIKATFDKNWGLGIVKALIEFSPTKIIADSLNGLSKWLFDFDLYAAGRHVAASLLRGLHLPSSVMKMLGVDDWDKAVPSAPKGATAAAPITGTSAPAAVPSARGPTMGARNNNPGNLRTWGDAPRDARGYAVFPTPEAGLTATIKNLQAQQDKHGLSTIREIISKWAPPGENNTAAYIKDIVQKTGFGADQKLDLHDQQTVAPLVKGIIKHEGNGAMFNDNQVDAAVGAQTGGGQPGATPVPAPAGQKVEIALTVSGLPKGMTVSATAKGGTMPVRVAYSMPTDTSP